MTPLEVALKEGYASLLTFSLSLTQSKDEAEDLLAEASYRALVHQIEGEKIEAWLKTTMKRIWIDRLRFGKNKTSINHEDFTLEIPDGKMSVAECVELADGRRRDYVKVHRILRNMPPALAGVLVHVDMDNITYEEAANIVGAPLNTVKSRVRRARRSFAQAWRRKRGRPFK